MFNKKPKNVTRFIGNRRYFNNNLISTAVFDPPNKINRKTAEISVFNIDKELNINDENAIYNLGDKKGYKKEPHTLARADLKTMDIEQVKNDSTNEFLKLHYSKLQKHCNIKPFPSKDALALNIAQKLVMISTLKVRNT